ncbi:hypothetical protein QQM41_04620 [Acetobacter sp. AC2005]|uniref:hypothetical protein n=1 Tax=Acetobacter sp. AC2005 TaxID=3134142 RepID=UPI0030D0A392
MRTREEQIADLENKFGEEGVFTFEDDRDAATKHILEAEQRGYERARAECAADTRRLDWLERQSRATATDGESSRVLFHSLAIGPWDDLRAAIDAAMEGGK